MTDFDALRNEFRKNIYLKTSWGRNELILMFEESISAALQFQLDSHRNWPDADYPSNRTTADELRIVGSAPKDDMPNDDPF